MRILILALTFSLAQPAAAFELNLNKLGDIFKKAGQLKETSADEEAEIGAGVASNLLGAAPLVKNETLQRYINRVGRWLALQTERPELAWHFGVLDHGAVNAFAAPGGYVFVTRGLLVQLNNEAELAGVLAHEIAHVLRKHHLNAIRKNAGVGLAADVLTLAAQAEGRRQHLDKVVNVGTELYARGLDKDDELEADRMAVVIAARAGYDPFGLPAVLQKLAAQNPEDGALALLFKTHPPPAERLRALDAAMQDRLDAYGDQPALPQRYRKQLGG